MEVTVDQKKMINYLPNGAIWTQGNPGQELASA
jgi:hypothetical protein